MSVEQFRDMVFNVSQSLKPEESHDIAYMYDLPEQFRKARPIEVLMQLEVEQKIYKDNPETLAKVLEKVKRMDLANKVKKLIKKRKKSLQNSETAIISDPFQTLHVELALSKMQIEYATHRIKLLERNFSHVSSADTADFKLAIDYCRGASHALTMIKEALKNDSSSYDSSSSDEESTGTTGSLHSLKSLWTKEKALHKQRETEYMKPIPRLGLARKGTITTTELQDIEPRGRTISVSSMNDSGFGDVTPFLRTRLQNNEGDNEAIYEELVPLPEERARLQTPVENGESEYGYTKLMLSSVTNSDYTTVNRHTRHLPSVFSGNENRRDCCEINTTEKTGEEADDEDLYCEVQY